VVGSDPIVCEILQLADRANLVEGVWQLSTEGDPQRDIDRFGPSVAPPVGYNGPHVRLALLYAQAGRGRDAGRRQRLGSDSIAPRFFVEEHLGELFAEEDDWISTNGRQRRER